jgi:hypothetical protein
MAKVLWTRCKDQGGREVADTLCKPQRMVRRSTGSHEDKTTSAEVRYLHHWLNSR